ncbi:MAG: GntR family transcriptional regulator [Candidatus Aminicenantes bacterium]|nr:GntR family transcriptional regulator [Candidatus Aminicenantes bacterium]
MKKEIKLLSFKIEAKSAVPVYEQVKQGMKLAIISGYLERADQVMSIRELAARLKIHPNTIAKVYYQLEVEGFIYSKPGTGYFVKVDHRKIQREKQGLFKKVTRDYVAKAMNLGYSLEDMIVELRGMDMENPIEKQGKEEKNDKY